MSDNYQDYLEGMYDRGNTVREYLQMKGDEEKAKEIVKSVKEIQEEAKRKETERILNKKEVTEDEINQVFDDYGIEEDKYAEYIVDGAILTCNKVLLRSYPLTEEKNGRQKIIEFDAELHESSKQIEKRKYTTLSVSENPIYDNGLTYATVSDTVKDKNISPFLCHCQIGPPDREYEFTNILNDPKAKEHGVCRHLMRLNSEWENLPLPNTSDTPLGKTGYMRLGEISMTRAESIDPTYLQDVRCGNIEDVNLVSEKDGITMTSILFCKHGGIITPVTSGQTYSDDSDFGMGDGENTVKEMTISLEYFTFLVKYEGLEDTWKYAEELSDGTVTIAFGVVIKDTNGNFPLGKDIYDDYIDRKNKGIPLTEEEALSLTETRLETIIDIVNATAEENNWGLSQNQFDALVDMTWNIGEVALDYTVVELIATGDLNDPIIKQQLEKEILETATFTEEGTKIWAKNLVERRLDVVRIVEGGNDAYTKNEFSAQWWNQNAKDFLLKSGISEAVVNKYPIQIAKEY